MYIFIAILGFSLLVIIHELGHFAMAKINGITVEEFSIGMGPEIISKKYGETIYSLRLFPIGGFVSLLGEEKDIDDEQSFSNKSPLKRISVILAGATMNIIFAIIIFSMIIFHRGYNELKISKLLDNSPAIKAGLQIGDEILKIEGSKVYTPMDVTMGIQLSKGKPINLLINRNNDKKEILLTPKLIEKNGNEVYHIGFYYDSIKNPNILQSVNQSFRETISLINQTFKSFKLLFSGDVNIKTDVGGPITIIRISTEAAKNGLITLGYLLAFISVNLAVFNLLPFPALDGGWAFVILIELITKRKIPDKIVGVANYIGFIILMGVMILVTLKDILFPLKLQ
ncbi:M50 family metallopeptidase [Clostridioides difficile]